jgi:molybdopterin synthase sulfur carrier subunit
MQITVRLLASYRQYLPENRHTQSGYPLKVLDGATVGNVLPLLPLPPDEVCTYLVNGRHAERNTILQEGDILSVFPAAGGG